MMRHPDREGRSQLPHSESLNTALQFSRQEAERLNHNCIGTEHLLLGLTLEPTAAAALNRLTLRSDEKTITERVRSGIDFIIGTPEKRPPGEIGLTPRAKKVLDLAADEAIQTGANEVNSIHALIGLIREGEGVANGVLTSLRISKHLPTLRRDAKKAGSQKTVAELEVEIAERLTATLLRQFEAFLKNPESDLETKIRLSNIMPELKELVKKTKQKPKSDSSAKA